MVEGPISRVTEQNCGSVACAGSRWETREAWHPSGPAQPSDSSH